MIEEIKQKLAEYKTWVVDLETTGLDPFLNRIIGIGIAFSETDIYYLDLVKEGSIKIFRELKDLFENSEYTWINQNIKFDYEMLYTNGIYPKNKLIDTMLAAHLLNENLLGKKNLVDLCQAYLGVTLKGFDDYDGSKGNTLEEKCRSDVKHTYLLWQKQKTMLEEQKLMSVLLKIETPLIPIISEMELTGITADIPYLEDKVEIKEKEVTDVLSAIRKEVGNDNFNPASSQQVGKLLVDEYKLISKEACPKTEKKQQYQMNDDLLITLKKKHAIVPMLLNFSKVSHELNTYYKPFYAIAIDDEFNRVRAHYNQAGTPISRMSSNSPNHQNLPREKNAMRKAMIAPKGKVLLDIDYNQLELRVMAQMSKDPVMIEAFTKLGDLHKQVEIDWKIERPLAKCLDGDTIIFTKDNVPRTIKEIIKDIEPDEHRIIPKTFLADGYGGYTTSNQGLIRHNRECSIVVTKRGVVCSTNDHRWLLKNGDLIETCDLRPGMELPIASIPELTGKPNTVKVNPFTGDVNSGYCDLVLDEKWGYFAGLFHGDGCSVNGYQYMISHGSTDDYKEWRDVVFNAIVDIGLPAFKCNDLKATRVGCTRVARMLNSLGLGNKRGKRLKVPEWVISGGRKVVLAYLAGLFDTDGTVSDSFNFTTKDPEFAGQVGLLLKSLGNNITVEPCWNKTYKRWYYRVHVLSTNLAKFADELPLRSEKKEKLVFKGRHLTVVKFENRDVVKQVIPIGERTVYDFHVDNNTHLFLQGGFIGHNNINFSMTYGGSWKVVMEKAGCSESDAKRYWNAWHYKYKQVQVYQKNKIDEMLSNNGVVVNLFGRKRRLNAEMERAVQYASARGKEVTWKYTEVGRQAGHFGIASSALDIMKLGMIKLWGNISELRKKDKIWNEVRYIAQVHDEILFECPVEIKEEMKPLAVNCLETCCKLIIPLKAEIGEGCNWEEAKN